MIPENLITATDVGDQNTSEGGTFGKASVYKGGDTFITNPPIDPKDAAMVIGRPSYDNGGRPDELISTKTADTTNSSSSLNTTYDHTNRSAKWKRPHEQDAHSQAKNQYESHN